MMIDTKDHTELCLQQLRTAKTLTEEIGALVAINASGSPARNEAFDIYLKKWSHEPLVLNKWLGLQALSPLPDTLQRVRSLTQTSLFDKNNPNKIYALLVGFARMNPLRFHDRNGQAYEYIVDQVLDIDSRNPQVASRLVSCFNSWKTLDNERQTLIEVQLKRMLDKKGLSKNVLEIVSKALQ